jgi:hypothetical protein
MTRRLLDRRDGDRRDRLVDCIAQGGSEPCLWVEDRELGGHTIVHTVTRAKRFCKISILS